VVKITPIVGLILYFFTTSEKSQDSHLNWGQYAVKYYVREEI